MTDPCAGLRPFARPGLIQVDPGAGCLPRLAASSRPGRCEVYLHGAHLTAWEPAGQAPVLWLSRQSLVAPGAAIRGGVPICWPWFGLAAAADLPVHGLARTRPWRCLSAHVDAEGTVVILLELASDAETRRLFPHDWRLRYRIAAGHRLDLSLTATNTGATPFPVSAALHTCIAVGDVRRTTLDGLAGLDYLDRNQSQDQILLPSSPRHRQEGGLGFAGATDLYYPDHTGAPLVRDAAWGRVVRMAKRGSLGTQIWNPWSAAAHWLRDLGDQEWRDFICPEAANAVSGAYLLEAGASHELGCTLAVL